MSKDILKPSGQQLIDMLNEGDTICNSCGAVMELDLQADDKRTIMVCPECGLKVDREDYEYDFGEDKEEEWAPNITAMFGDDILPEGCMTCGGPYPYCKLSCNLFDD